MVCQAQFKHICFILFNIMMFLGINPIFIYRWRKQICREDKHGYIFLKLAAFASYMFSYNNSNTAPLARWSLYFLYLILGGLWLQKQRYSLTSKAREGAVTATLKWFSWDAHFWTSQQPDKRFVAVMLWESWSKKDWPWRSGLQPELVSASICC